MAADPRDEDRPARALGRALRDLQRRSGCTLKDLEEKVLISDSSLSRYFRGTTVPPWETVRDLCRALDGDPSAYRHLWLAAEGGQRDGAAPAQAPEETRGPSETRGPEETRGSEVSLGSEVSQGPEEGRAPEAPPVRRGRVAWGLAGAVLGLAVGITGTALVVRPGTPLSPSAGDKAPPSAGRSGSAASDVHRIFVSRATGSCLDDSLDKGTRSYACNGMSYQRWTVHTTADGGLELRNHATGRCLDLTPDGPSARDCGTAASQRWTVTARDDTAVEVRSATSALCLDDGTEGLRAIPCDRSVRQQWG
ncbi:XRE family transcriptional regulator [Streptomyces sp. NPDC020807]|uniref:XRE family transcriptional regulator n=1 Tax=Streptomyces sp. NPDC020807 TaxID=3155119 RepID=UPI003400179B